MKRIFALILALTMMVTAAAFASAETTMPIVEEPITMTMMIGLDTSRGYDPADNAVFKYLEEVTNIHWDFIVVDRSSWTERLSLMWASGDMPDMIYNGVSGNDLLLYTGTLILDLKPYLEEYAPQFLEPVSEQRGCAPGGRFAHGQNRQLRMDQHGNRSWRGPVPERDSLHQPAVAGCVGPGNAPDRG